MLPLVFSLIALSCYAMHPSRDEQVFEPALTDTSREDEAEEVGDGMEEARNKELERQLQELKKNLLVYYINTDQEEERRENMETQASKARMPLRRFKAVDRHRISMGEFDNRFVLRQGLARELLAPEREKDHVRNATVACYVSHAQLLEELQRILGPSQVAVVLEDDVEIPHNWLKLVKKTLDCAPEDWSLLKVSGWGYNRNSDRWKPMPGDAPPSSKNAALAALSAHAKTLSNLTSDQKADANSSIPPLQRGESVDSALNFMGWLQSHGGWMSRILYGEAEPKPRRLMRNYHPDGTSVMQQSSKASDEAGDDQDEEELSCPDTYLMRQPFKEQFWWHFWGPAFHYAGTGAYIVKASSISRILQHLQSQPIDDIDGMLLSKGELRAYELWPHIFPLNTDHMRSTLLSTETKEEDIPEEPAERPGRDNTMLSGLSSWLPSWDSSDSGENLSSSEGQRTDFPCKEGLPCNSKDAQLREKKMPSV